MVLTQICFTQKNFSLFIKCINQTRFSFKLHKALKFSDFMNLSQRKMKTENGCLENTTMKVLFRVRQYIGSSTVPFSTFEDIQGLKWHIQKADLFLLHSWVRTLEGKKNFRGRSTIGKYPLTECIHVSSLQPPRVEPLYIYSSLHLIVYLPIICLLY